ncbi:MAG: SDR family NAD(P)-dependent oxidoreductase [Parachlamydiales bacterium]|nr:SDR family NAD(P)-dependent oxidoreductase [Parachlamydiales bacterium]
MKKIQKALITGATSGLGLALAKLMSQKGIQLILVGRDQAKLTTVAQELTVKDTILADLSTQIGIDTVAQVIEKEKPDCIINNAGFGHYSVYEETPYSKWNEMISVNLLAPSQLSWQALKTWKNESIRGTLVNVASVLAMIPMPYSAPYSATKSYILSMSEALQMEVKGSGINVLAFCPGQLETPFRTGASSGALPSHERALPIVQTAKALWHQIQTLKPLVVYNWRYQLLVWFVHCLPRQLANKLIAKSIKKELAQVLFHRR